MDKAQYLMNFGSLEKKDKRYYLFKAFLSCLNNKEVCELIKTDFSQDILTRFLITQRIVKDLKIGYKKHHEELVEQIFERIDILPTYHKKQAASKFLTEIFDFISIEYQKTLVSYLFNSPYTNDRKRSYGLLYKKFDYEYENKLIEHLHVYQDGYPLWVIVNCCSSNTLNNNFDVINQYFTEDNLRYDWQLLKIRTKFYGRLYKLRKILIKQIKFQDPISYMYIMREIGKKVTPNMAWKSFLANPNRNSLLRLYSDLDLWEVLVKIDKYQKSH